MIHDSNKKLINMRFTNIEAEIGPDGNSEKRGGAIKSEVKMAVSDLVDNKNTATVTIDARGIPQGASEDEFAFHISITGVALWEWLEGQPPLDSLQKESSVYELCYAVHTMIVGEVSRLALLLGFPGVALSWNPGPESDLSTQNEIHTPKGQRKKSAK